MNDIAIKVGGYCQPCVLHLRRRQQPALWSEKQALYYATGHKSFESKPFNFVDPKIELSITVFVIIGH